MGKATSTFSVFWKIGMESGNLDSVDHYHPINFLHLGTAKKKTPINGLACRNIGNEGETHYIGPWLSPRPPEFFKRMRYPTFSYSSLKLIIQGWTKSH